MNVKKSSAERKPSKKASLQPWQVEDAKRLKSIFSTQKTVRKFTETSFAEDYFDGVTQGAINQYLNGRTPLNLDALLKFSIGLGCLASEISPTLAEKLSTALSKGVMERHPTYSPEVMAIADIAETLDSEGKKALCESAQKEKRIKEMKEQLDLFNECKQTA